jgi:hypothetical protein
MLITTLTLKVFVTLLAMVFFFDVVFGNLAKVMPVLTVYKLALAYNIFFRATIPAILIYYGRRSILPVLFSLVLHLCSSTLCLGLLKVTLWNTSLCWQL